MKHIFLFLVFAFWIQQNVLAQTCNCKDYLYLNEPGTNSVHKFEIPTNGPFIEILNGGNAWYPGTNVSELPNPHGLGTNLNGFLFIGETSDVNHPTYDGQNIRKLTCAGDLAPESEFYIPDVGNNFQSIDNTLFVNGGSVAGIRLWDLCTGLAIDTLCFNDPNGNPAAGWELDYNKDTDTWVFGGMGIGVYKKQPKKFMTL